MKTHVSASQVTIITPPLSGLPSTAIHCEKQCAATQKIFYHRNTRSDIKDWLQLCRIIGDVNVIYNKTPRYLLTKCEPDSEAILSYKT